MADVKLTKGEEVTHLDQGAENEKVAAEESKRDLENGSDPSEAVHPEEEESKNAFVEALVPKFVQRFIHRLVKLKKRVGPVLLCLGLIALLYSMYKKGFITELAKTSLVRTVVKLLFNYDLAAS